MIMKLLLIIGVIGFVYFFFIKKKPALTQENKDKFNKKQTPLQGDDMIECPVCSIYFEVDDGILSGNKYYCSSECVSKAHS